MKKVLIADTEPWAVAILRGAVARLGYDVCVADNGVDTLAEFRSQAPELVIADSLLEIVSGLDVAAKIRATAPGKAVPIVLTSALHQPGDELRRLQRRYGVTTLLSKPFNDGACDRVLIPLLRQDRHAPVGADMMFVTEVLNPASRRQLAGRYLGEVLLELLRDGKTGVLVAQHHDITRTLFYDRGAITLARSNSGRDALSGVLLRIGAATSTELDAANDKVDSGASPDLIGALIDAGLSEDELTRANLAQMSQVILDLATQSEADYRFQPMPRLPAELARFELNAAELIFWAMRRIDGTNSLRQHLPSPSWMVRRRPGADRLRGLAGLTNLEEQVLTLVDGNHRMGDLQSVARFGTLDISRVLLCLLQFGVIEATPPEERQEVTRKRREFPIEGDIQDSLIARMFAWIGHNRDRGRLRVREDEEWRQVYFEEGEIVWAQSSLDRHRLGKVLLDIGAVSEKDLEEALRLQTESSGRRLGGVLLEQHALTLEELDRGRRVQIQRIVTDALCWRHGHYVFEREARGAQDRVTLPLPTSELIFESLRHTKVPDTIRHLLRSPDTVLMAVWSWDRIDAELSLSRSERRLLEVLEAGQTAAELAAFGIMRHEDLERVVNGLLTLDVIRAVEGQAMSSPTIILGSGYIDEAEFLEGLDASGSPDLASDEDASLIRLGATASDPQKLRAEAESLLDENERLRQRIARLEAALDRRDQDRDA